MGGKAGEAWCRAEVGVCQSAGEVTVWQWEGVKLLLLVHTGHSGSGPPSRFPFNCIQYLEGLTGSRGDALRKGRH